MTKQNSIVALIMAAGMGERLGGALPKQYQKLGGKAILVHAIERFLSHADVDQVFVVIHPDHKTYYEQAVGNLKLQAPIIGGATRQESVRLALQAIQNLGPNYVLIHDAARPFVSIELISNCIAGLTKTSGSIAAVRITDSLKRQENAILNNVKRSNLWSAQTPQCFPFSLILEAHHIWQDESFTDDAALAELHGIAMRPIISTIQNFKITTADDLKMAETLLKNSYEYRTGSGFDVHRFCEGDHVVLGNVKIPFSKGVDAHSDGDVILHALTDAILGSIGAGDIGQYFPPSDAKWRNADSAIFVEEAVRMLQEKSGIVVNADITVLGEEPKISKYRSDIQRRAADLLKIDRDRVAIKATTTEKLGFLGRSEGIAAQAIVMVKIPI